MSATPVRSAYDPAAGAWRRGWPERVSKHDIVWRSPPEDPAQGLPFGNGDLGALLWTEGGRLFVAVNKNDAWDDNSQGELVDRTCEQTPSLSQCCKLEVDFGMPVFDLKYQDDFTGRVSIADGTVLIDAATPFAKVRVRAWASFERRCLVLECDVDFQGGSRVNVSVEKWGSRTFSYWYDRLKRDASIGLGKTVVGFDMRRAAPDTILVRQGLNTLDYTAAARLSTSAPFESVPVNANRASFAFAPSEKVSFSLALAVVTSENDAAHEARAFSLLDDLGAVGLAEAKRAHDAAWKDLWERSFVDTTEDYLDNIWHLMLYYGNSTCRGDYPPFFAAGMFGWNADFMPWTHYLHWNMRLHILPFHAAGCADLAKPYFRQMTRQYRHALKFATDNGYPGAYFTDLNDRSGKCDAHSKQNIQVGACIALEFWRQYRYTGDAKFLAERAWPVMRDVSRFFAAWAVLGNDNRYHFPRTQGYEGTPLYDDAAVTLAVVRGLLEATLAATEIVGEIGGIGEDIAKWRDVLDRMADFTYMDLEPFEVVEAGGVRSLAEGIGKGRPLEYGKALSVGKFYPMDVLQREYPEYRWRIDVEIPAERGIPKDTPVRSTLARTGISPYYGLYDSEMGPAYPAEIVGLADRDTDLFQAVRNMTLMHHEPHLRDENGRDRLLEENCGGWCHFPIVMSRMGLRDLCVKELRLFVGLWQQCFVQGFGHYMPSTIQTDCTKRWATNEIGIFRTKEKITHPRWPYRHFDYEPMPIAATAHAEMLLQSFDGALRLFAATPEGFNARFHLLAADGFTVDAELVDGTTAWCAIEARADSTCTLVNHLPERSAAFVTEIDIPTGKILGETELRATRRKADDVFVFTTKAGRRYLVAPERGALKNWTVEPIEYKRNEDFKALDDARLGMERMF